MDSVVRYIKNNVRTSIGPPLLLGDVSTDSHVSSLPLADGAQNVPSESAGELKSFFSAKAQPGNLTLADERDLYRSLPLSTQIQARAPGPARPS